MYKNNIFDDMSGLQYSVGDVANILGVHPNTVRYFDKAGVINPERDDSNRRRIYSSYEVYLLTLKKQYQNMGFSIAETNEIFKDYSLKEILDNLKKKSKEQEEKIEKENLILEGTESFIKTIEEIPFALNRYFLKRRPPLYRHPHLYGTLYTNEKDNIEARRIFTSLMPLSYYSFILKDADSSDESKALEWDMVLPPKIAKKYDFDKIPGTFFEPEAVCVYTVFKICSTEVVSRKHLRHIDSFIRQNHLTISGNISGRIIINVCESGKQVRFFEAWIPIKDN